MTTKNRVIRRTHFTRLPRINKIAVTDRHKFRITKLMKGNWKNNLVKGIRRNSSESQDTAKGEREEKAWEKY